MLISAYLVLIYIIVKISLKKAKNKDIIHYKIYPCYLNIILSFVISLENFIRLLKSKNIKSRMCYFQAFGLSFLDKLVLTSITVNTFLTYLGLSNITYYMNNIKKLFIITNSIGFIVSLSLSVIFICKGVSFYDNVCYVKGTNFKEKIDTVVTFLIYIVFLYSILQSLFCITRIIKELSGNKIIMNNYLLYYYKMLISLFLSSLTFFISILIINDSFFLEDDDIDLCYVLICLILVLFYTLNETVINVTLKLFGFKKEKKKIDFYEENDENDLFCERTESSISLENL